MSFSDSCDSGGEGVGAVFDIPYVDVEYTREVKEDVGGRAVKKLMCSAGWRIAVLARWHSSLADYLGFSASDLSKKLSHNFLLHFWIDMDSYDHHAKY